MDEGLDFNLLQFSNTGSYNVSSDRGRRNPLEQAKASFALLLSVLLSGQIRDNQISSYFEEGRRKLGNFFLKANPKTLAAAYALVDQGLTPDKKDFQKALTQYTVTLMESLKSRPTDDIDNYKSDIIRYYTLITGPE